MPIKFHPFSLCLAALVLLSACSTPRVPIVPGITPYRIDIQQGNIVTQEMLDKLEPGMSRNQVRFILGTPLIVDPFRTDRWDYVYRMNKRGDLIEQRQLKVFFKDDRMVRYEGDVVADAKPIEKPAAKVAVKPAAKPGDKPAASAKPDLTADLAKPAAKPQPKPVEPVSKPEPPKPAPPLAEVPRDTVQPQLRLAPSQGAPATPAELAAAAAAPKPKPAESLEAVPLPRIEVPPEPAAFAGTPPAARKPESAAAAVKPGAARREDVQPGSAPAPFETLRVQPAPVIAEKPAPVAPLPQNPVEAPLPKVAEKPAPKPVEKPAAKPAAKSEPAVASKSVEKPASGGLFGRMMDTIRNPPPPTGGFGGEREARPGEPPAPFVDPPKPAAK